MIYDCFSFFNELDILEIRLNVLYDVVDRFVIAESAWTHTGQPKAFIFDENRSRFARFADKIIHLKITETPTPPEGLTPDESRWFLENYQRNALVRGLADAQPDDVIMVSDCDEIPDPEIVKKLPKSNAITHFHPRNYTYYLNSRDYTFFFSCVGTTALKHRRFNDLRTYAHFPFTTYVSKANNPTPTMTQVRYLAPTRRYYCGWHFSYIGGAKSIKEKLNAVAEGYIGNRDKITEGELELQFRTTNNALNNGHTYFREPVTARHLPAFVAENKVRYHALLLETSEDKFRHSRIHRVRTAITELLKVVKDHYFIPYASSVKYAIARMMYIDKN